MKGKRKRAGEEGMKERVEGIEEREEERGKERVEGTE